MNGIFGACPICGEKYNIPIYVCSNCGKEHKKLIPGKYGIFNRRCQCGNKMPTMFMDEENLRLYVQIVIAILPIKWE